LSSDNLYSFFPLAACFAIDAFSPCIVRHKLAVCCKLIMTTTAVIICMEASFRGWRTCLSIFMQVEFQRLSILLETQNSHGPYKVITIDSFSLLSLALIAGPAKIFTISKDTQVFGVSYGKQSWKGDLLARYEANKL
jgi:hypothetical protein